VTKKILVIDANPSKFGLTACLAEEYIFGAKNSNFDVEPLIIRDLKFDPILHFGYNRRQKLEPDLEKSQELLKWCEHLVIFSPVWWYSFPALLKGFFDRAFLPEFAFTVTLHPAREAAGMLSGKSATSFYTYAGPENKNAVNFTDPFGQQLKHGILQFCGFENIKTYPFYEVVGFKNIKKRQYMIEEIGRLGTLGE
jgi:putative NADPH-quinone reductase